MQDAMLTELYMRVFRSKQEVESHSKKDSDDRLRQVALAKNTLLSDLISIRTDQLINGQ